MKERLSLGDTFVDCDGEELRIVKIGERSVVLRCEDKEVFVATIDDVLQDIASGELFRFQ